MTKDTAIDFETAKKNICEFFSDIDVNFVSQLLEITFKDSSNSFSIDTLKDILPSVYSFCHHHFLKNSTKGLPLVSFATKENPCEYTTAWTNENHVFINQNSSYMKKAKNFSTCFEFLQTMFHELKHVSQLNDDNSKNSIFDSCGKSYSLIDPQVIDTFVDMVTSDREFFKFPDTTITPEDLKKDLQYKHLNDYWFDNYEIEARTASDELTDIIFESLQELEVFSDVDKKAKYQQASYFFKLYKDLHLGNDKNNTEKLPHFKKHPELDYAFKTFTNLNLVNVEKALKDCRTAENEKDYQAIATSSNLLGLSIVNTIGGLNFVYDKNIASSLMDTMLENTDLKSFCGDFFNHLLSYTEFIPSKDQVMKLIDSYKFNVDQFEPNNLVLLLETFNTKKSDELIKLYSIDNPFFLDDLESFNSRFIILDDNDKAKYRDFYLELQDKTREEQIDFVFDEIEFINSQKQTDTNQNPNYSESFDEMDIDQ